MCEIQTLKGLFSEKYETTPLEIVSEGYMATDYNMGYKSPTPKYIQFQNPSNGAWIDLEQMGTVFTGCDLYYGTIPASTYVYDAIRFWTNNQDAEFSIHFYPSFMGRPSTSFYITGIPANNLKIRICDENHEWLYETELYKLSQSQNTDSSGLYLWYNNSYLPTFATLRNYYLSVALTP